MSEVSGERTFRQWLRGSAATSAAMLVCGVASGVITARVLHPDGRGLLAAVLFWPQLIGSLTILGVQDAVVVRRANLPVSSSGKHMSDLMAAALLAVGASILAWILLPSLLGPERTSEVALCRTVAVTFLPLSMINLVAGGVYRGDSRMLAFNLARMSPQVFYLVAVALITVLDVASVGLFAAAAVVAHLPSLVVFLQESMRSPAFSWSEIGKLLTVGSRFHLATVLLLLATHLDRMLVFGRGTDLEAGLYVVAWTFSFSGASLVMQTFDAFVLPAVAKAAGAGSAEALLRPLVQVTAPLALLSAVVLAIAGVIAIPVLFGSAYSGSVASSAILSLGYAPLVIRHLLTRICRGLGYWRASVVGELLAVGTFLAGLACTMRGPYLISIPAVVLISNLVALGPLALAVSKLGVRWLDYFRWSEVAKLRGS